jgi:hypothetical protein
MERQAWEQALARAVTDVRFQVRLLANPGEALLDYGLDRAELPLLELLRGTATLGQLAGHLLRLAATVWGQHDHGSVVDRGLDDHLCDLGWEQRRKVALVCKDARRVQGRTAAPLLRFSLTRPGIDRRSRNVSPPSSRYYSPIRRWGRPATEAKAARAASPVRSISFSEWASETNPDSNWDGAR